MVIFNINNSSLNEYLNETSGRTRYVDKEISLSKKAEKEGNKEKALIHAQNAAVYTNPEDDDAIKNGKYIDPHKHDRSKETIEKLRKGKNLFNYDKLDKPIDKKVEKVEVAKTRYGIDHNKRRIQANVLLKRKNIKEAAEYILSILDESEKKINDFDIIKKEANNSSKIAFENFKNIFNKNDTSDYNKMRLEELDKFYKDNKTYPKVSSIKKDDSDYYCIYFNIKCSHDFYLFYQDCVCKELNKNAILKNLGYKFETEDYPGIYIIKK